MKVKVIVNRIVKWEDGKNAVMTNTTYVEVPLKSPNESIDYFLYRMTLECARQDLTYRMPLMKQLTENRILIEWEPAENEV